MVIRPAKEEEEKFSRALERALSYGVGKYFIYLKRAESLKVTQVGDEITVLMPLCTFDPEKEPEEPHAYCIEGGVKVVWKKGKAGPVEIALSYPR